MAPKKTKISLEEKIQKRLAHENKYLKIVKCFKLKTKVWELSALCHAILYYVGPDGKVSNENLDEVKSILKEYWLKKPLEKSSNILKVFLDDIKKRTADIDRDWESTEELRGLWKGLESQLGDVIEKTSGVVKDNDAVTIGDIGDIRKSIVEKNESLSDHSDT